MAVVSNERWGGGMAEGGRQSGGNEKQPELGNGRAAGKFQRGGWVSAMAFWF